MISVIIPSYNSEQTISNCLKSIEDQSYTGDFEIIVVDSSYDGTPEVVSSDYPVAKLIRLNKRTDPGTARNIGIGVAKGDLVAFMDADCVAAPDWLERMAAAHESSYDIAGGIVRNSPESSNLVGRAGYMAEFRDFLPAKVKGEVTHIPTCNVSYKKRIFREFGLFQGKYYPQEDLIFHNDLCIQGEKILLDPDIQVWHRHRTRLGDFLYHQYRIGEATSRVLRTIPLEGSSIAKRPFLAISMSSFIALIKFVRTLRVFLRHDPEFIIGRPLVLAVFALGLVSWAIGFAGNSYGEMSLP